MTLDQYLALEGHTVAKLAAAADTTVASITRLLYGDQLPSAAMIKAIVNATNGSVTADDLIFGAPRVKPERSTADRQDAA